MKDILEIAAAVLAVFGAYQLLGMLKLRLGFPPGTRRRLRAAVYLNSDAGNLPALDAYVKYLRREGKISEGRLIILANSDIIKNIPDLSKDKYEVVIINQPEVKTDDAF